MNTINLPKYYNRFQNQPHFSDYKQILFRANDILQSAEVNEIEGTIRNDFASFSSRFILNGEFLYGGKISISTEGSGNFDPNGYEYFSIEIVCEAGMFFFNGDLFPLEEKRFNYIDTLMHDADYTLGIKVVEEIISYREDSSLLEPANNIRNFRQPGADRLSVKGTWEELSTMTVEDNFTEVSVIENGIILEEEKVDEFDKSVTDIVAEYDRESRGNYLINGFATRFLEKHNYLGDFTFQIGEGKADVFGYKYQRKYTSDFTIPALSDFELHQGEPTIFNNGEAEYELNHTPIRELFRVSGEKNITQNIDHGSYSGATDTFPSAYTPVVRIKHVFQGGTVFVSGRDFYQDGDQIVWLTNQAGEIEPAPNSSYTIEWDYRETQTIGNFIGNNGKINGDKTGITLLGYIPNSVVAVDYDFVLQRKDVISLDSKGLLQNIQGVAREYDPLTPRFNEENLLSIAEVLLSGDADPEIVQTGQRVFKFEDIEKIYDDIRTNEYNLGRMALKLDLKGFGMTLKNTFVDTFMDDAWRDAGIEAGSSYIKAMATSGELVQKINWETLTTHVDEPGYEIIPETPRTVRLRTLGTSGVIISQPHYTGLMQVTELFFQSAPKARLRISPSYYSWIDENIFLKFVEERQARTLNKWTWFAGSNVKQRLSKTKSSVTSILNADEPAIIPQITLTLVSDVDDFNADEDVEISWGGKHLAMIPASNVGKLSHTFTVPPNEMSGSKIIDVLGLTSGVTGTTTFFAQPLTKTVAETTKIVYRWVRTVHINRPPIASAGHDKEIIVGNPILISGTGSDRDAGTVSGYAWKRGATLLSTAKSFTYTPSTVGDHVLVLTVTDNEGASASDTMILHSLPIPNVAPTANAGGNKSVYVNSGILINGTASDSDGTVVSYQWREGALVIANSATFTYTPTTIGNHVLTLYATDDDGAVDTDTMVVASLEIPNVAPTANAGGNKKIIVNTAVTIVGSGSDSDGSIVSYLWKEGTTVLSNSNSFSYTPTTVGNHTLTLTVTDDDGATDADTMMVTADNVPNVAPTANAGGNKVVYVNSSVIVTGSGSDSDGTIVSYLWKEGTTTKSTSASFTYTPTTVGNHTLTLTVTDNDGAFDSDSMVVTSRAIPNKKPTANAGGNKRVYVNGTVGISGSGSDSDGSIASYQWKRGSTILSNSASFNYVPNTTGNHVLTLYVTDDDGAVDTDTMIVSSIARPNKRPVANAGANRSSIFNRAITISGSGSDSDGSIVSYQWREGSTVLSNSRVFAYTPRRWGNHVLTLYVTDNRGAVDTDTMIVSTLFWWGWRGWSWSIGRDPVAQSFTVGEQSFVMDSVKVWFETAPTSDSFIEVVEMTAGQPDNDKILTVQNYRAGDIADDSSFVYDFAEKMTMEAGKSYAFVIGCEDPNATVHVATLGERTLDSGEWMTTQAYTDGVMFNSSNDQTWSALQKSDMRFEISSTSFESARSFEFVPVNVTDATDLMFLSVSNKSTGNNISYDISLLDLGPKVIENVAPFEQIPLGQEYTGQVQLIANMTSDGQSSPELNLDGEIVAGKVEVDSTYTSVGFKFDPTDEKIVVYCDRISPGASSYTVEVQILQAGAWNWVPVPLDTSEMIGEDWYEDKFELDIQGETPDVNQNITRVRLNLSSGNVYDRIILSSLRLNTLNL